MAHDTDGILVNPRPHSLTSRPIRVGLVLGVGKSVVRLLADVHCIVQYPDAFDHRLTDTAVAGIENLPAASSDVKNFKYPLNYPLFRLWSLRSAFEDKLG